MKNGARPKSRRHHRTHPHNQGSTHTTNRVRTLENLRKFEDYASKILPVFDEMIKNGASAKEIREAAAAILQAKTITEGLMTDDPTKTAAITKDVLDRVEGKATEKKEVTHKFSEMKDEELDAILKSEIEELEDMESRFEQ